MRTILRGELQRHWREQDLFAVVQGLQGTVVRAKEGRRTLRFELEGRGYYCKLHNGLGWREIAKNLFQGRLPVLSAANEWRALERLSSLGLHTLHWVAYGRRGCNPARQCSFLVTEELRATRSLEEYFAQGSQAPPFALRRALLEEVARITRSLHDAGVNHRDLYLCHFLLQLSAPQERIDPGTLRLYLVDLHRAQLRRKVPPRWRAKDLAGLYFSAFESLGGGLSRHDVLRFLRAYFQYPPRLLLRQQARLLRAAKKRAQRIHRRHYGHVPAFPL